MAATEEAPQQEVVTEEFERKLNARLIMSIIATGIMTFSGMAIESSMNVSFPVLMREYGITTNIVQWLTTSYVLVVSCIIPTSAHLGNRFKTKPLFLTAILIYSLGLLVSIFAPTFWFLLVGRVLEGLGTGLALPLMYSIIVEQTPYENMGLIMAFAAVIPALALTFGPGIGGVVAQHFGWRMLFMIMLPIVLVCAFLGAVSIKQSHKTGPEDFDFVGWFILIVSIVSLVFFLALIGGRGLIDPVVLGLLAICIISLLIFSRHSKRTDNPVISLEVFKYKGYSMAVPNAVASMMLGASVGYLLPNYCQFVNGGNQSIAGLLLIPGTVLGAVAAPIAGRILDKYGARVPMTIGSLLSVCAMAVGVIRSGHISTIGLVVLYFVYAFYPTLCTGNSFAICMAHLPERLKPHGNSVNNTLRQLAAGVGTCLVTSIVAQAQAANPDFTQATIQGTRYAFVALLIIAVCLLFLLLSLFRMIGSATPAQIEEQTKKAEAERVAAAEGGQA